MERQTNSPGTKPNEPATPTATSKAAEEMGTASPRKAWQARRYLVQGWRFARHLLEMVVAMMVGMAVLGLALAVLGEPPGYANLLLRYGLMGPFMAAPMVGWMHYRGHSWSDGGEMTAAMLVPMFALVVPVELGVSVPGLSEESLMMLSHVAMIAGMVAWMIYRFERYATGSAVTARSASAKTSSEVRRGRIPENGQLAREAQEGISTPGSTFRWMPHYLDLQYHRRQPLT